MVTDTDITRDRPTEREAEAKRQTHIRPKNDRGCCRKRQQRESKYRWT